MVRHARPLGPAELAKIDGFVGYAQEQLGIPGIAVAIVQGGTVIHAKGYGVRDLNNPEPVDADTLFMIGSNTKALTTLLLATLADERKLRWDQPVRELMPSFTTREATATLRVEQLSCMCAGFPRRGEIHNFERTKATPQSVMNELMALERVVKPGTFLYSGLAAASGYLAAHVVAPGQELGSAYDAAMKARVFEPLGMRRTTFDFAAAAADNHAEPHIWSLDLVMERLPMELNHGFIASRPAGGAWSSANDMIQYVRMELARGINARGERVVSEANLLKRRQHYATFGEWSYGLGLIVDRTQGTTVVFHRGSVRGEVSWQFWLPDYDFGAVILANAQEGHLLDKHLQEYMQELLFNEDRGAWTALRAEIERTRASSRELRGRLLRPPPPALVAKLSGRYHNEALGALEVTWTPERTVFDFGEWKTEVAQLTDEDGEVSLWPLTPGFDGVFVVRSRRGRRTLIARHPHDGDYTFIELATPVQGSDRPN